MNNRNILGISLIIIGLIIILDNIGSIYFWDILEFINIENTWPIIPSLIAFSFWYRFSKNVEDYELLMPASIFSGVSVYFWLVNYSSHSFEYWPIFILAPALGLWLMQFSSYKKKDYLIPAVVMSSIGIFFMIKNSYDLDFTFLIGFIVTVIGLILILRKN